MLADGHTLEQCRGAGPQRDGGDVEDRRRRDCPVADRPPACRAGCAHCCHQTVGVTPPEVFAIYDHLRATRTAGRTGRRRAAHSRRRRQDARHGPADRLSPDLPCPFLVDERCSIYEVRPLSCRGTNSLDAAACERSAARSGGARGVPRRAGQRPLLPGTDPRLPRGDARGCSSRSTSCRAWRCSRWS